jgi:predicted CXXCH cytochrome family protein
MLGASLSIVFAALGTSMLAATAQDEPLDCIGCHDFGPDSPVERMIEGPHGKGENEDTPMFNEGCIECHGPSIEHAEAPTRIAPSVSFGPRWIAEPVEQDLQCLTCHEELTNDTSPHESPIPDDHIGCTACHDLHLVDDPILTAGGQDRLCTVCHKAQHENVHGLESLDEPEPACTLCHAPHRAVPPEQVALENRSAGCASCHNLLSMATDPLVGAKANNYHRVMASEDRTCIDCHAGIAHAAELADYAALAVAQSERDIQLFRPGQSHSEWLLSAHPGSMPMHQGGSCQLCHRGEESRIAAALVGSDMADALTRDVSVRLQRRVEGGAAVQLILSWPADGDDDAVSVMWADDATPLAARDGCFAACHRDMPGMDRDRGLDLGKYLWISRRSARQVGQPTLIRPESELQALRETQRFAELWRADLLQPAGAEAGVLLDRVHWESAPPSLDVEVRNKDQRWEVVFTRLLGPGAGGKVIDADGTYTIGIALHDADKPDSKHWISLPFSLSFTGDEADLRVP